MRETGSMPSQIRTLETVVPAQPDRPALAGPDHPMRKVTRQVAFESGAWTPERAAKVAQLFDAMAPEWGARTSQERQDVLRDAISRGDLGEPGQRRSCIEIGSGTGSSTKDLAGCYDRVVALDLSREMLRHAPPEPGLRVQADAARLPLANACADAIVLVNALLFPNEVDRVLAPRGVLVWVNSLGDRTPIHLSAEDVAKALPGEWTGVAAEAGWGIWCTLRRLHG
jgi:SAM-dependent methyltransferase